MKKKLWVMCLIFLMIFSSTIVRADVGTTIDLKDEWNIIGNGYKGTFTISEQTGNEFSGKVNYSGHGEQRLVEGKLVGDTMTFTRLWENSSLRQYYTGNLVIDSKGMISVSGTFTQTGTATVFMWSATKTKSVVVPQISVVTGNNMASPFDSGVRISWVSATGLGYRLFRSTVSGELGISVTDFYITSTSYADVNVEPNTTYYYSVKPVIAEAKPFEGIEEQLGAVIATFTVKTGGSVYKPGSFKHFIMLEMDNPMMTDNGTEQEIDPGRGTTPLIISGRTMVPIRAIVEAMGGTLGWDNATSKITLKARGNVLEMWLNKTEILINGVSQKMDVAPVSRNGRTYVPVRFAAENLQSKVDYINSTREAVIIFEE